MSDRKPKYIWRLRADVYSNRFDRNRTSRERITDDWGVN